MKKTPAYREDCKELAEHFYNLLLDSSLDLDREIAFKEIEEDAFENLQFTDSQLFAAWARACGRAYGELCANEFESPSDNSDMMFEMYKDMLDNLVGGVE